MKCLTIQINKRNKALSQFKNYNFNSLVKFGPHYLGTNPGGLYKLGGSTDDGSNIEWKFKPVETDFGLEAEKHVRYMYFGINTSSDFTITAIPDNKDPKEYTVPVSNSGRQRLRKSLNSNHKGTFWEFEFSGMSDFDMEFIRLLLVPMHYGYKSR